MRNLQKLILAALTGVVITVMGASPALAGIGPPSTITVGTSSCNVLAGGANCPAQPFPLTFDLLLN